MKVGRCARAVGAAALLALGRDAAAQSAGTEPPAPGASEAGSVASPVPNGVAFGADQVKLDTKSQSLDVSGHVRVDEPPFHLTSEELALKRVPIGVELDGHGKLAFCPCLGTPLALRFSGATVAPPYDVILKNPVVEIFGVPVAWAPAMWLRTPARAGLLPPDLAWRGADGFFAGGGVHVPWRVGDDEHGVDVRVGAYVQGGVAAQLSLATPATSTRIGWDRLRGDDAVSLDAHGAIAFADEAAPGEGAEAVAWQIAALRGARGVRAATDVGQAARPFDRGEAEVAWRPARAPGWTFSSRVESVALRGGAFSDLGAAGPILVIRRSDALGGSGTYDATLEGGQLAGANAGATSFARAEANVRASTRVGPVIGALSLHGIGQVADDVDRRAADGAAQLRTTLGLPLVHAFASTGAGDAAEAWVQTTEPRVELAAIATRTGDVLVVPGGRGMTAPSGGAWVAAAGWSNAIGRSGSRSAGEVDAAVGAVGDDRRALLALRARAAAAATWVSLRADVARVGSGWDPAGGAFVAQARAGSRVGLSLAAHVAERDGVDPLLARALVDPTLEPASGFLSAPGWTGGLRAGVPLGAHVTVRGGADVDLNARELVAAVGSIELHDPCNCVVVRANGASRIGRGGVDIWVSVDLPIASR